MCSEGGKRVITQVASSITPSSVCPAETACVYLSSGPCDSRAKIRRHSLWACSCRGTTALPSILDPQWWGRRQGLESALHPDLRDLQMSLRRSFTVLRDGYK